MAVVVEIGPAVWLAAGDGKKIRLHELELGRNGLRCKRSYATAGQSAGRTANPELHEPAAIHSHAISRGPTRGRPLRSLSRADTRSAPTALTVVARTAAA